MPSTLREGYTALVFGASGAIGQAFVELLQQDARCAQVTGLSRNTTPPLLLQDEASLHNCAQSLSDLAPFDLIVDATGALTIDGTGPEKRLSDLGSDRLAQAFQVNAIGPALLMKHFVPLMPTGRRAIWAKLSARVGSIEDNHKGRWYGYRASKAALNMLLQTAAIEISRQRPQALVAALQPGTVRSRLSQPFVAEPALAPKVSAQRLLAVLDGLEATGRAHFVDHLGQTIAW